MDLDKIPENAIIKQSNRLIEAKYTLTQNEQKLMLGICAQLNPNAKDFSKVRISVDEMANFCHFDPSKKYTIVKETLLKLLTRVIRLKEPNGKNWYATHWLQAADYIDSEGIIEYHVDERLKPELLQLKAAYLSTLAAPILEFKRTYSARLYLVLKKMLKVGKFEYSLDFFRERFMLEKTYDKFSNIKDKVFEPAIAEINVKSDINVIHEYIKEGRSFTKIRFEVKLKKNFTHTAYKEMPKLAQDLSPEEMEERDLLTKKLAAFEIDEKKVQLFSKYDFKRINDNFNYALIKMTPKIESKSGWILYCIENNLAESKS